ncbi:hypothetical protein NEOLEDRAFT_1127881 [Neolentinus lepideus HHB14362 ss-1]|uniref:Uncharacterized protein n=1 Tax=Neolentinus lepideus HHB14362 ss-1 TaxID=1314782 RepID=A0A165VP44_9AGAM|nr:hypothetical protein NEOLEDRAFT_1127881 [Neolentinus lepideus HHB14362 ss-1]
MCVAPYHDQPRRLQSTTHDHYTTKPMITEFSYGVASTVCLCLFGLRDRNWWRLRVCPVSSLDMSMDQ